MSNEDPFDAVDGVDDAAEFHELDDEERLEAAREIMEATEAESVDLEPGEVRELSGGVRVRRTEDGDLVLESV